MTEQLQTFSEYQSKAIRTMKPDPFLMEVLHCTMGMVGEAGEFKELPHEESEKKIGEIGDCMWYAAVLSHRLELNLDDLVGEALAINTLRSGPFAYVSGEDRALLWACRLTDLVKKSVFYGKELDRASVVTMLTHYWAALLSLCSKMSVQPLFVALTNVRKLEARYPDKMFNADHANNRDYAVESAAAGVQIA